MTATLAEKRPEVYRAALDAGYASRDGKVFEHRSGTRLELRRGGLLVIDGRDPLTGKSWSQWISPRIPDELAARIIRDAVAADPEADR